MPRKPKASKKPYGAPSARMLDANAARAELEAKGMPEDPSPQTETPQTRLSHGTFVEQPSPEVCSQLA